MSVIEIVIPGTPPTPNARYGNVHAAARTTAEWRGDAKLWAVHARNRWDAANAHVRLRWRPLQRCAIGVVIVLPDSRRHDFDNFVCSLKPLTDGLVDAGIMVDDSTDVIRSYGFEIQVRRGTREVRYTVSEVGIE